MLLPSGLTRCFCADLRRMKAKPRAITLQSKIGTTVSQWARKDRKEALPQAAGVQKVPCFYRIPRDHCQEFGSGFFGGEECGMRCVG